MNRPLLAALLLAASAGRVHAQESKLVNCRSLEAAGNFVGPEEVLDGDRVCKRAKAGDAEAAKPEATKSAQVTLSVVPAGPSMSVAEAARANAAAKAEAKKIAGAQKPVTVSTVPPSTAAVASKPAPVAEPRTDSREPVVSSTSTPVVAETSPAPKPEVVETPVPPAEEAEAPAFRSANLPVEVQPKKDIARNRDVTVATQAPASPVRIRRDAPVAAGTPSDAPEKDYGFSDANAAATSSARKGAPANPNAKQSSGQSVQTGGFDKSQKNTSAAASEDSQCAKNITLGTLGDDKFTVGASGWAEKWITKNHNRMGNVCFSDAPTSGVRNYLIVFYTAPGNGRSGSAAMPVPDATSGAAVFTAKDGAAWSYAAKTGAATTLQDGNGPAQIWYATAYSADGVPVAERWPDSSKRGDEERTSEDLLNIVVEDLRKL